MLHEKNLNPEWGGNVKVVINKSLTLHPENRPLPKNK